MMIVQFDNTQVITGSLAIMIAATDTVIIITKRSKYNAHANIIKYNNTYNYNDIVSLFRT